MAYNIPMPDLPGDALLKGLDTGSNMMARLMNARYNASLHPSGDVANALYVQQMRNQYGENDPRYLEAKRAHDLALAGHQSLMDYRTQLSNLAPYRAATPEEKLIAAQGGHGVLQTFGRGQGKTPVKAGMVSGEDGHVITEQEAKVYNQALGKKTTDAAIRNQIPFAKNVEITLDSINPDDLVQYSGPHGTVQYGMDFLNAAMGNPSPQFLAYRKAVTSAKMGAKQLRQFWKDSIQPSAREQIEKLTNPTTWNKNPEVAKQEFEQLRNITKQELQTFREAGTSPLKLNYKNGMFYVGDQQSDSAASETDKNSNASDDFLKQMEPRLLEIDPEYTSENIKHTAKKNKIKIEDLVKKLMSPGAK